MKKTMLLMWVMMMVEMSIGGVICSGNSASVAIDSRMGIEPVLDSVPWDASWIGCNANATIVITDNGDEVKRATGVGDFVPSGIGRHDLTYTTYIDGVVQEEVYTAVVYSQWKYDVLDSGASIVGTAKASGTVEIPSEIDGLVVTRIGEDAFAGCNELTSVVIPDGVMSIGAGAFSGCSNLAELVMPDSVTGIEEGAFYGCGRLASVAIPNKVTSIATSTFWGCSNLLEVSISDSVTSIGKNAFRNCSALTNIVIPKSVMSIGTDVLAGCCGLTSITMPFIGSQRGDNTGAAAVFGYIFGDEEFKGGTNAVFTYLTGSGTATAKLSRWLPGTLRCVTITDEILVARGAFDQCTFLTNIVLNGGITYIGEFAFCKNSFKSINIPNTVTQIDKNAFSGCGSLTSVTIPNSVTSIGAGAFSGCSGLTSITLPFIGSKRGNTGTADSVFGYIFGSSSYTGGRKTTQCYDGPENSPSVVYYIPSVLKSVTITDELVLGYGAFYGCNGLANITINSGVASIGGYAFRNCTGLYELALPAAISEIKVGTFRGCSRLGSLTLPDSVTSIGDVAFADCSKLTSVVALNELTKVGYDAFYGCNNLSSREDGYKVVGGWLVGYSDDAAESISGVDDLRGIAGGALEGCTALKSLEFSDKAVIGSIGTVALKGCTELQSLVLPSSLKSIGDEAFMGCSYLGNVIVPGSAKSVGARAFKNCTGFTNAQIEYGVESLGEEAFYGDWRISEVDIPSTVTNIGKSAFGGDSSIIRVGLRGDIRTVAEIFSNYKLIREATVKEGTGAIVDGLFTNCTQLADVRFFGNCPALVNDGSKLYQGTKSGLKTYVSQDSTGWDGTPGSHQLPQAWPLTGSYRKSIAYWDVPTYLVEFDSNGGTLGVQSTYQYSERPFTLPPEPVQTGYRFAGWWTKPSGGLQVTTDTVFIEGVYRRLYAHWLKGHWVFLNPNGGTVTNDFVTYIEQTVYGVLPAAVRTGYAFGGWKYNGQTVLPTTPISTAADHTLVAQWEAYKYSVKFNANGGEGEMADEEMTYDVAKPLSANAFRRVGYAFAGWSADSAANSADFADGESVVNLTAVADGEVELFAVWKKDCSNVTLETDGDAEWFMDSSVTHDGAVVWRSGMIGDEQRSVLRAKVTGPGKISFWWKVDCEWFRTLRLDSLAFSVDEQEIQWINGEEDWMHVEFDIADEGEHVLEWTYAKDGQDDDGEYEDCGWVSEVMWIPVLETLNDYLNCTNLVFETSGDAAWFGQREVSHDGFGALRSGSVGDNRRSCLSATVNGPGVVSFWWKTDCEASYRTYILDHLAFYVDGEEKCVINGNSGWEHRVVPIGSGQHAISWVYEKDEEGAEGEDCTWLDEVMCMPTGAFPEVANNSEVVVALAGTADETSLAAHITTKSEYDRFRSWVNGEGLSHALVKDAPNAWLSYALDAPSLMAKAAPLTSEDVVIESIEPSSITDGAFDLVVNIAGAEIGEGARLAEALGVEGAAELDESAFSFDGLSVSLTHTADGKARATVMPDGAPTAFFMRVRVK